MKYKMNEELAEKVEKSTKRLGSFLPLNLQYFADGDGDGGEGGGSDEGSDDGSDDNSDDDSDNSDDDSNDDEDDSDDDTDDTKKKSKKSKSFSQKDVSNIAAREAKKAEEKLLARLGIKKGDLKTTKAALEEYRKLKDAEKTEKQKADERVQELEETNNGLLTRAETAEAKLTAFSKGANADSVDDVIVLAKNMLSADENMEIDDAIEKVLEKYPHFKGKSSNDDEDDSKKKKKKPKFSDGEHDTSKGKKTDAEKWIDAFKMG